MSKVKITISSKENSVKINDQEINDIITDLTVNVQATTTPTVTLTLAPMNLEINGESFSVKKKMFTATYMGETTTETSDLKEEETENTPDSEERSTENGN